ncbi:MAG: hypothetical protein ACE5JA_04475 [bacterium]
MVGELFSTVIVPPLTRRREKWFESIAEALRSLAEQVEEVKIENLAENEMFVTTVMQASQAALRNHQEEKLEALRNAVLNAALPNAPEEGLQSIYLGLVEALSPLHLRVLKFFENPRELFPGDPAEVAEKIHRTRLGLLIYVFPDIKSSPGLDDYILKDLSVRGLIKSESLNTEMALNSLLVPYTTALGKGLLHFIASPLESSGEEARQDA